MRLFQFLLSPWILSTAASFSSANATAAHDQRQQYDGGPFQISLHDGLVANGVFGGPLSHYDIHPYPMFMAMASAIRRDASSSPYQQGSATSVYNLWPKLTTQRMTHKFIDPTYLVRISITDASADCARPQIKTNTLLNVALLLETLAQQWRWIPYPFNGYAFSGSIWSPSQRLFDFRLFDTGIKPARDEKKRNIDAGDLAALNYGRAVILGQTTPQDLIIFLGGSGSYFYYTINRPHDRQVPRRQAFLLPVSQPELWTAHTRLDLLMYRKEYQTFVQNQIVPIFRAASSIERVILVDYTVTGSTILGLQKMLFDHGIWTKGLFYINIESPNDPHRPYPLQTVTKLRPITIDSFEEMGSFFNGLIGRVVTPYPWFYWDAPPSAIQWPGKDAAPALIDIIRNDRFPDVVDAGKHEIMPTNESNPDPTSLSKRWIEAGAYNSSQSYLLANSSIDLYAKTDGERIPEASDVPEPPQIGYICGGLGINYTSSDAAFASFAIRPMGQVTATGSATS